MAEPNRHADERRTHAQPRKVRGLAEHDQRNSDRQWDLRVVEPGEDGRVGLGCPYIPKKEAYPGGHDAEVAERPDVRE